MAKIFFLLPDEQTATNVVADLKSEGVNEGAIGVLAARRIPEHSLPMPDASETSDFKPAVAQGVVVGGGTGLLAGLAIAALPGGFAGGVAALAGMALAGGAFGAWVSGMVGASMPNREIAEFESAIQQGKMLMMVDADDYDEREMIKQVVLGRHRQVAFGGQSEGLLSGVGF